MKATATRAGSYRQAVKVRDHRAHRRRAHANGRRRRRPEPAGAARREPRLVHGDHDGDVRRRARAGTSAASRSPASTRRPSAAARRASTSCCAAPTRSRTSRSSACGSSPRSARCTARSTARSCSKSVSSASRSRADARGTALRSRPPRRRGGRRARRPRPHRRRGARAALRRADGALHAVFTRRRDDMRRHAGEISFPGGRQDDDETDLRLTALREAEEEIGLPARAVELVGALQPTPTIATDYAVYPFVGLIEPGHAWRPSAGEVAAVLELSLERPPRRLRAPAAAAPRRPVPHRRLRRRRATSSGARRRACSATCSTAWPRTARSER